MALQRITITYDDQDTHNTIHVGSTDPDLPAICGGTLFYEDGTFFLLNNGRRTVDEISYDLRVVLNGINSGGVRYEEDA